jgi:hypothetical protein
MTNEDDDQTVVCKKRCAFRVVQYRPLLNVLKELVSDASFRNSINFKFEDQFAGTEYRDILEGKTWQKHKKEMTNTYQEFIAAQNGKTNNNIDEVSLYLSLIFDGVKLYDRSTDPCWPLGISIQNLPPNLRGKPGIGSYLLSLITTSINSASTEENCRGVAYFIFRDCLLEELLALGKGICLKIYQKNKKSNGMEYEDDEEKEIFLQCRLLLSVLDGRGLEEFFHYQGANSKTGCAICGVMKGRYSKILSKTLYGECRIFT